MPKVMDVAASNLSPQEKKEMKAQRKEKHKEKTELINKLCASIASFRRNFFGMPFEKIFKGINAGKLDDSLKLEISFRKKEMVWVVPSKDRVTVFFGVNFDDVIDCALAKLILNVSLLDFHKSRNLKKQSDM